MTFADLPTPALVVDLPVVERNLRRMAEYTRQHGLGLRPHTKTHKSLRMARRQIELGAVGLTAAKAGEAETMAACADDLFLAYPALDAPRTQRLAALARTRSLRVGVDSAYAAERLAEAARADGSVLGILVDVDVGYHRTGVQSPEDALALGRLVARTAGLRLDGLMCFPGHVTFPKQDGGRALNEYFAVIRHVVELWKREGLEPRIISGGSTPTAYLSHDSGVLTEIRPGTYIYNDLGSVAVGHCTLEDCAARIVCTVVSDAVPGKVVLDAGSKTLTQDRVPGDASGVTRGRIVEYPDARLVRLSEEHGEADVSASARRPRLGERVTVIPNHICPCVNLQSVYWLRHADGRLEEQPVDARGKLS